MTKPHNPMNRTPEKAAQISKYAGLLYKVMDKLGMSDADKCRLIGVKQEMMDKIREKNCGYHLRPIAYDRMRRFYTDVVVMAMTVAPTSPEDPQDSWLFRPHTKLMCKEPLKFILECENPHYGLDRVTGVLRDIRFEQLTKNWGFTPHEQKEIRTWISGESAEMIFNIGKCLEVLFNDPERRTHYMNATNKEFNGETGKDQITPDKIERFHGYLMGFADGAVGWHPYFDYGDNPPRTTAFKLKPVTP